MNKLKTLTLALLVILTISTFGGALTQIVSATTFTYEATIIPTSSYVGQVQTYTIQFMDTGDGTGPNGLGSADIIFPAGYTVNTDQTLTVWTSTSPQKTWIGSLTSTGIHLRSQGDPNTLSNGESVFVTFVATNPIAPNDYQWETTATTNSGQGGHSYIFQIIGGYPITSNKAALYVLRDFPSPIVAGTQGSFTVTAKDENGYVATSYTGTVQFTSTDTQAVLPSNYQFTIDDKGVHTFVATLKTAGTQSITASDIAAASINGSQQGIVVTADSPVRLVVAGYPDITFAGIAHDLTVMAKDAYGNNATGFTGTVTISSTDPAATLPSPNTLTNGVGNFTVTLKTAGTQTITATSGSLGGSQTNIQVNVGIVGSVIVTPAEVDIIAGNTGAYTATAYDQFNNLMGDVTNAANWEASSGATITAPGSATATTVGSYTITATWSGKQDSALLKVTSPAALDHIIASVNPTTIAAPGLVTGSATAFDTFGNSWDISTLATWTIPAGGDGGSWTTNIYTSHTAGTYTVKAEYGGQFATASLTVTHATDVSQLAGVAIAPVSSSIEAGQAQAYTATATDTFGNSWDVTSLTSWSISSGAQGAWTDATYTSEKAGTWTVTGVYLTQSDLASLTVTHSTDESKLASITITPDSSTIAAGQTQTYTATATDIYGNTWDVTTQLSSNNGWTITSSALGTWSGATYTSEKAGTWTVTGIYLTKSDTASLTVTHATDESKLASVTISPDSSTIAAGQTQAYLATATDTFGNSWDVTALVSAANGWSITSDALGSWTDATYTSEKAGTWTVTGVYLTQSGTASLTVTHATDASELASVSISPDSSTIVAGQTQSYIATATDTFGNSWDVTSLTSWSITSGAQGIWNDATYTSEKAGVWTVTGAYLTKFGTASLTVTGNTAALSQIVISPQTSSIVVGTSQTYSVEAFDQYGNDLGPVTSLATFEVNGSPIVGNIVSENQVGSYSVTASYNGLTDSATLTVTGYIVTFTETGLPAGTTWTVTFDGVEYSSTTDTITIADVSALTYSWSTTQYIQAPTIRFVAGQTSGSMTLPSQVTQQVDYSTQYLVTYDATGNVLAVTIPLNEWVNSEDAATGTFELQVVNVASDVRCNLINDNRTATINAPTTITANYQTQYKVTYAATGNVLPVVAPSTEWINSGNQATDTFTSQVINEAGNVRCNFVSDNRPSSIDNPTMVTATYQTQYLVTYATTGNALTATLPADEWVNSGSAATGIFNAQIVNSAADVRCNFVNDNRTAQITSPTTVTAAYQTQYFIKASAGNNGAITPSGSVIVNSGSNQLFTVTPNTGYHVVDVLVDGVSVGAVTTRTFTNVIAAHTISASFAINTYTITASAGSGGSISPTGSINVNHGDSQSFTIAAIAGYQIADMLVDGTSIGATSSYQFTTVTASHSISASFKVIPSTPITPQAPTTTYLITVASAHGSPTRSAYVNAGDSFKASVTSPEGNTTHRWICTGYSIDSQTATTGTSYTFTGIQASHTIVFNWQEQYYLTINSTYGNATGQGWYNIGATANINVTNPATNGANTQYVFSQWTGTGVGAYTGSAAAHNVTMNNAITEIATWTTQYKVTYTATGNATSINLPATQWVTSGAAATGTFPTDVANVLNNARSHLTGDNKPTAITQPTTVTANYQTQYKVVFSQSGIESDATGTILTIQGDAKDYSQITATTWINNEAAVTFNFTSTVSTSNANKQYSLSDVNATSPLTINEPTAIQAAYKPVFSTSLYTVAEAGLIILALILLALLLLALYRRRKKTIIATADSNGTISPAGKVVVKRGNNQTFNITPAANYQVSDVQVDGKSVGAKQSYTFQNVTDHHTINATFQPNNSA